MTMDDEPAVTNGGSTTTSGSDQLAGELPAKLRVHALAKQLGMSSKDVLAALAEVGSPAKSAQASIDRETALRAAAVLLPDPSEPGGDTAEDIEDGALAAPLAPVFAAPQPLFLAPEPVAAVPVRVPAPVTSVDDDEEDEAAAEEGADDSDDGATGRRRRRRGRRGRGRGRANGNGEDEAGDETGQADEDDATDDAAEDTAEDDADTQADEGGEDADEDGDDSAATRRRRRRRRRKAADDGNGEALREDDPPNTVVHVRDSRPARATVPASGDDDGVQGVRGSTRLEAKRQRRRDGREAGRRRPPILSEAEFLARRESVERVMVVREHGRSGNGGSNGSPGNSSGALVQMGVLEDGVLVEHFVTSAGAGSLVGNVYLGRVQNVLPSMEAAFVDIGRGRNAVLYAGEVDWDAAGLEGKSRKIEQALSSGDSVLVQVTKDPVGHKGARLTTQISLPGRFLVYVPGGGATGISRKLPDTERKRLKDIMRRIVPDDAGVIIRTASEGVAEEALARDVRRLQAQWEVIKNRSEAPNAQAPQLLYEEPDLLIKVVRDLFTEDFSELVVQGRDAMDTIEAYVEHVAPDLAPRVRRHVGNADVFAEYRIDEQLLKALDRKVWLPSGGYLVIDRTEAMTVIDVNTGKFTGSGGNLEETVTRNNLEAAEEIVRQLRLRDIGGIIVIDFIDMVLESNRDLVLRRLTECLGRDRTRHQVAEVTSLGLVQMTRKRVGSGLLEAFSTPCEHCRGRGVIVSTEPVEVRPAGGDGRADSGPQRRPRSRGKSALEPADVPTKPADAKSTEAKPADAKPADAKSAAAKPADAKSTEAKPADGKPADGQPATKPAEAQPANAKRGDAKRANGRAAARSANARTADGPAAAGVAAGAPTAAEAAHAVQPADAADAVTGAAADAVPGAAADAVTGADAVPGAAADAVTGAAADPQAEPAAQPRSRRRSRSGATKERPADAGPEPQPATAGASPAGESQPAAAATPVAEVQSAPVPVTQDGAGEQPVRPRRRRAASRPAGPPAPDVSQAG
jgi:ribonuclease E